MSISFSGFSDVTQGTTVAIQVSMNHPLIQLAQIIDWKLLGEMVLPDLKKTAKGCWKTGNVLYLRNHLGAYLLQKMFDKKDRATEWETKDNAAYMLFCGFGLFEKWSPLDHTSISKFRKRLSPETQRNIANYIAKLGVNLGYGDASELDQDSTIQEANASYPADVSLMLQASEKVKRVIRWLKKYSKENLELPSIDIKTIKKKVRQYYFTAKKGIEKKKALFKDIYNLVDMELRAHVDHLKSMKEDTINLMPWNIMADLKLMRNGFNSYMNSVLIFIETGKIDPLKILSWNCVAISCFNKGKLGKKLEFGRNYQLGRIGGNFAIVGESTDVRMEDKKSISSVISTHQKLFGKGVLKSFGADKGYYSKANQKYLWDLELEEECLQKPGISFKGCLFKEEEETYLKLVDRRSMVEGMIGNLKLGGQLGKSRMKSDKATLAAGYGAVAGYNLRCLSRHLKIS